MYTRAVEPLRTRCRISQLADHQDPRGRQPRWTHLGRRKQTGDFPLRRDGILQPRHNSDPADDGAVSLLKISHAIPTGLTSHSRTHLLKVLAYFFRKMSQRTSIRRIRARMIHNHQLIGALSIAMIVVITVKEPLFATLRTR